MKVQVYMALGLVACLCSLPSGTGKRLKNGTIVGKAGKVAGRATSHVGKGPLLPSPCGENEDCCKSSSNPDAVYASTYKQFWFTCDGGIEPIHHRCPFFVETIYKPGDKYKEGLFDLASGCQVEK